MQHLVKNVATVHATLGQAVQKQTLREVATAVLEDNPAPEARALAEAGIAACDAISAHMLELQQRALDALRKAGVDAGPVKSAAHEGALQFHHISIHVPRAELGRVMAVLGTLEFQASVAMTPGRINALSTHAEQITLIRFDAVTARLTLVFTPDAKSLLPARLRPGLVEMGMIDLPPSLSFLYPALKPIRILGERLTGRRSPYHEIDFLGTPDGLIAPILAALDLRSDDVLVDLGCGDGRVVLKGAETFGCRAIGVEHNGDLVARARRAAAASPAAERIDIREGDASAADLDAATVVFMFLPKNILRGLLPDIRARISEGASVAVHEQTGLSGLPPPDRVQPVFSPAGITVLHVWSNS